MNADYREGLRLLIEEHCKRKRITPYELARYCEVTPSFLYGVMNGKKHLSIVKLEKILRTIGCRLSMGPATRRS